MREDGSDPSPALHTTFGEWDLTIERSFVFGKPSAGAGIIIRLDGSSSGTHRTAKFLLIGYGFQAVFKSLDPKAYFSGILSFSEKEVVDPTTGEKRTLRRLNGDETRSGKYAMMPAREPAKPCTR